MEQKKNEFEDKLIDIIQSGKGKEKRVKAGKRNRTELPKHVAQYHMV